MWRESLSAVAVHEQPFDRQGTLSVTAGPTWWPVLDRGAVREGVDTLSAVLAGGSFATDCLFLVWAEPCDKLIEAHHIN